MHRCAEGAKNGYNPSCPTLVVLYLQLKRNINKLKIKKKVSQFGGFFIKQAVSYVGTHVPR